MNIIFLGPQGSGKGTQARLLSDKYGLFYFESGAYLRKISEGHPDLKKYMNLGKLVPDKEMTSYLTAFLDQEHLYDDIIFDGFPRTLDQYNFLKKWLNKKQVKINLGIVIEIGEKETIRRLSGRRIDPKTGNIYNLVTDKIPSDVNINDLIQREDDSPEAIKKRLELYKTKTESLIAKLTKDMKIIKINGERPVPVIHQDIIRIYEQTKY